MLRNMFRNANCNTHFIVGESKDQFYRKSIVSTTSAQSQTTVLG